MLIYRIVLRSAAQSLWYTEVYSISSLRRRSGRLRGGPPSGLRQECFDVRAGGRGGRSAEPAALEPGGRGGKAHGRSTAAAFGQRERKGTVKDVAGAQRVDCVHGKHRA